MGFAGSILEKHVTCEYVFLNFWRLVYASGLTVRHYHAGSTP